MQVVEINRGHGAAFMRAGLVLTACGHCHDFRLKTGYKVRPLTDQRNSGTDGLKAWQALVALNELARSFRVTSSAAQVRPHAIESVSYALAILGGFLEFIPVAGWLTTLGAILSVAVVSHSHWIWMAILMMVWRVLQDYLFCPRIMGRHLRIHSLAAIFAILVGAEVGGIVGIYLAIPLMASVRVIWQMWAARKQNAAERHRGPAATTELLTSPTPCPVGHVEATPRTRKQIELTENVAQPAYGQHGYCAPDTRVVFSTNLNNLHGP